MTTDTTKGLVPFPFDLWPKNIPPSDQLVTLYRTNSAYRASVDRMVQLLKDGKTAKDFRNHPHLGLRKLGNWFKDRRGSFERTANRGSPSPALDMWPGICWHLGPCPLAGQRASVHRINDLKPYVLGNLEWADKTVQAIEKMTGTRLIRWQGKQITDRQLIDELKKLGIHDKTPNAIKQFRKNHKKEYPSLDALHDAMLRKWGVLDASTWKPFKLVPDFLGDADIENGLLPRKDWETIINAHKKTRLSPLEIQSLTAKEMEAELLKALDGPENGFTHRLTQQLHKVRDFRQRVQNRIEDLKTKRSFFLCDLIKLNVQEPDFTAQPAGFQNYPDAVQSIAKPQMQTPLQTPPQKQKEQVAGAAEVEAAMKELGLL